MSLLSGIHSADAQRQDMPSVYSVYSWDIVTTGVNITLIDTLHLKPVSFQTTYCALDCLWSHLDVPSSRLIHRAEKDGITYT